MPGQNLSYLVKLQHIRQDVSFVEISPSSLLPRYGRLSFEEESGLAWTTGKGRYIIKLCSELEEEVTAAIEELGRTMGTSSIGYERAKLEAHCSCSRSYDNVSQDILGGCEAFGRTATRLVISTDETQGYLCGAFRAGLLIFLALAADG